jgi:hypothetical protein
VAVGAKFEEVVRRFGLGTLVDVSSAFVAIQLFYVLLLALDIHTIKYSAAMLLGVTMLTLILQFCSGKKHGQIRLFGSLVETNKVAPISSLASIGPSIKFDFD